MEISGKKVKIKSARWISITQSLCYCTNKFRER